MGVRFSQAMLAQPAAPRALRGRAPTPCPDPRTALSGTSPKPWCVGNCRLAHIAAATMRLICSALVSAARAAAGTGYASGGRRRAPAGWSLHRLSQPVFPPDR